MSGDCSRCRRFVHETIAVTADVDDPPRLLGHVCQVCLVVVAEVVAGVVDPDQPRSWVDD